MDPHATIRPRHQVVCGNCWRVQMGNLAAHGPGLLVADAAMNGTVNQVTYVARSAGTESASGPAVLADQPDLLQAVRTYNPLRERLVLIRDRDGPTLARVSLGLEEHITASMMLAWHTQGRPLPGGESATLLATQQTYTASRWQRQVAGKRPGERHPLHPRPQTGAALHNTTFQGADRAVITLIVPLSMGALRQHAPAFVETAGRGCFFLLVEPGWQMPWFFDLCRYLTPDVLEQFPPTPETEAGDRDLKEMVRTYDPQTQVVVVVVKPDADPSRGMAVQYLTPDATPHTPAERHQQAHDMMQSLLGLPADTQAILDQGDPAGLERIIQALHPSRAEQTPPLPDDAPAATLPPHRLVQLGELVSCRLMLVVFPPSDDVVGAITPFRDAAILMGPAATAWGVLPPLPAGWNRVGLMGSAHTQMIGQGQRMKLTMTNLTQGAWACVCDWEMAQGRCADTFVQAQEAFRPQKMSLDPRLIVPLLFLTRLPDLRPGMPGGRADAVRWLAVLDDLHATLLPLLNECFTAWLDGPSRPAREYARQTGRPRGKYRLGDHPDGEFLRRLVGPTAVRRLSASERIEPAVMRLLETTSLRMWHDPPTIQAVRRVLDNPPEQPWPALATALLSIALWQPAESAPAVLPDETTSADAAVIRQVWEAQTSGRA